MLEGSPEWNGAGWLEVCHRFLLSLTRADAVPIQTYVVKTIQISPHSKQKFGHRWRGSEGWGSPMFSNNQEPLGCSRPGAGISWTKKLTSGEFFALSNHCDFPFPRGHIIFKTPHHLGKTQEEMLPASQSSLHPDYLEHVLHLKILQSVRKQKTRGMEERRRREKRKLRLLQSETSHTKLFFC